MEGWRDRRDEGMKGWRDGGRVGGEEETGEFLDQPSGNNKSHLLHATVHAHAAISVEAQSLP